MLYIFCSCRYDALSFRACPSQLLHILSCSTQASCSHNLDVRRMRNTESIKNTDEGAHFIALDIEIYVASRESKQQRHPHGGCASPNYKEPPAPFPIRAS